MAGRMTQQDAMSLWKHIQAKEAARIQAEESARNLAYQGAAERSGLTGPTQAPPEGWQPPTEAIEPSWSPVEEMTPPQVGLDADGKIVSIDDGVHRIAALRMAGKKQIVVDTYKQSR